MKRLRARLALCALAASVSVWGHTPGAVAGDPSTLVLKSVPVLPDAIRLDGNTSEWDFAPVSFGVDHILSGRDKWTGADDLSFVVDLGHDPSFLLIMVDVDDDTPIRGGPGIPGDDKVALWFGWDEDGLPKGITLNLYPRSRSGLSPVVRWGALGGRVPSSKGIVLGDSTHASGWRLEVAIPWKLLPPQLRGAPEMLFAVSVFDNDKKGASGYDTVMGTTLVEMSAPAPAAPGKVVMTEYDGLMKAYLRGKSLTASDILWRGYGNLGGGAWQDMAAVTKKGVVFLGADLLPEGGLFHTGFDVASKEDLLEARLCNVDADAALEVCARTRESSFGVKRDIFRIVDLRKDHLEVIFAHELRREGGGGTAESGMKIVGKGRTTRIEVVSTFVDGYDKESIVGSADGMPVGCHPVVSEWDDKKGKKRTFALRGGVFVRKK